jgi:predicted 2-oxoglutarate/Fe(II)-dependent dioxygenase YbiX
MSDKKVEEQTSTNEVPVTLNANDDSCTVLTAPILSEKECDVITEKIEPELWQTSQTMGEPNDKIRVCKQQVLPINPQGWPHKHIDEFSKQANKKYKFDISGFLNNDIPLILKYEKGEKYDWHIDTGRGLSNRKLSFIIQLSDSKDYTGGDVEFLNTKVQKEAFRQKGQCIIFPSFLPHRISQIKKGTRLSIVGWIHGNSFV